MSQIELRIFRPAESETPFLRPFDRTETVLIPFRRGLEHQGRRLMDVVTRARLLHENLTCPYCQHARVEPIELADALMSRNNLPIPGTASLVGFACGHCHSEWPA